MPITSKNYISKERRWYVKALWSSYWIKQLPRISCRTHFTVMQIIYKFVQLKSMTTLRSWGKAIDNVTVLHEANPHIKLTLLYLNYDAAPQGKPPTTPLSPGIFLQSRNSFPSLPRGIKLLPISFPILPPSSRKSTPSIPSVTTVSLTVSQNLALHYLRQMLCM